MDQQTLQEIKAILKRRSVDEPKLSYIDKLEQRNEFPDFFLINYAKISPIQDIDSDLSRFRRSHWLRRRVSLYLQDELIILKSKLDALDSGLQYDQEVAPFTRPNHWNISLEVEHKIKQYNELLCTAQRSRWKFLSDRTSTDVYDSIYYQPIHPTPPSSYQMLQILISLGFISRTRLPLTRASLCFPSLLASAAFATALPSNHSSPQDLNNQHDPFAVPQIVADVLKGWTFIVIGLCFPVLAEVAIRCDASRSKVTGGMMTLWVALFVIAGSYEGTSLVQSVVSLFNAIYFTAYFAKVRFDTLKLSVRHLAFIALASLALAFIGSRELSFPRSSSPLSGHIYRTAYNAAPRDCSASGSVCPRDDDSSESKTVMFMFVTLLVPSTAISVTFWTTMIEMFKDGSEGVRQWLFELVRA